MRTKFRIIGKDFFDMYEDEAVQLVEKVQDFNAIDNSFTDFTFSFAIPATDRNLNIFDFYNEPQYSDALDPYQPLPSELYLDDVFLSSGNIQLQEYVYESGQVKHIQIQYIGEGTNLKRALTDSTGKDIMLNQLFNNWVGYDHVNDVSNVASYLQGNPILSTYSGLALNLKYVAASQDNKWVLRAPTTIDGYRRISSDYEGILNTEVRPAIPIRDVVNEIFSLSGFDKEITFEAQPQYLGAYLWLGNGKKIDNAGIPFFVGAKTSAPIEINNTTPTLLVCGDVWQDETKAYRPNSGIVTAKQTSTWEVKVKFDTNFVDYRVVINGVPGTYVSTSPGTYYTSTHALNQGDVVYVQMISTNPDFLNALVDAEFQFTNTVNTYSTEMVVGSFVPNISCSDFLLGILRTFNAVLYYDQANEKYVIDTRLNWLSNGNTHDITKQIDTKESSMKPPVFFKTFALKWKDAKDYLNEAFTVRNNKQYGEAVIGLNYKFGEDYEQENTFTNTLWQEVVTTDTNGKITEFTNLPSFQATGETGCRLMYFNGTKTLLANIKVSDIDGTASVAFGNINDFQGVLLANDFQLAYNAEYNYSLSAPTIPTDNVYSRYYGDYVSAIYRPTLRRYRKKAWLNVPQIKDIRLNDRLLIDGKYYMINTKTVNLLTGETDLELITELFETVYAIYNDEEERLLVDDEGTFLIFS